VSAIVEIRVRDDVLGAVLVRLGERDVVPPTESVSTELTEEAPAEIGDIRWEFAGLEEAVVYFLRPFASAFAEMLVAVERVREDADVLPGGVDRGNVFQALTALATRLTLIHEEGRTARCPRVLMDECG
jgi:hypothetical protein